MFTTLQKRLISLAAARHELAAHYLRLATRPDGCPRVRLFFERLADEERQLADGLTELAHSQHAALGTWIQFPRRLPKIPEAIPLDLDQAVALSRAMDDAVLDLQRPLQTSPSHTVREWIQALAATLTARERSRSTLLALET